MKTLQQNKGLVSLLVVLSFGMSGWYTINWLLQNVAAREIIAESAVFFVALTLIGIEAYTRLAGWNEERQTRPARKAKN